MVDVEHVIIRECGFTNYLLHFEEEYVSRGRKGATVKDLRNLYRSMIVYLSNNSYLCDDPSTVIYSTEEMVRKFHVGIPNQVTAISRICENDLKELEPLKYICNVRMGNRVYESELTEGQKQLLERLGVAENDVRK